MSYEYEPFLTHIYLPREPGDDPGTFGTLPYHHKRTLHTDSMGRVDWTEEKGISDKGPIVLHTSFAYDAFDTLYTSTDPKNNKIVILSDVLGRTVQITDPDAGVRKYTLNGLGEIDNETTPLNQKIDYKYDALSRLTLRNDSEGVTQFAWDQTPNGLGQLGGTSGPFVDKGPVGVPNGVADVPRISTGYSYNALGQLELSLQKFSAADGGLKEEVYTTTMEYDNFGRPRGVGYPNAGSATMFVTFDYNANGYRKSVTRGTLGGGTKLVWETLERDANLALVEGKFGNNVLTHWTRNPITGLVDKITSKPVISAGVNPLFEVSYGYDTAYNVKSRSWNGVAFGSKTINEEFTYDILDRLSTLEAQRGRCQSGRWASLWVRYPWQSDPHNQERSCNI
ncbi:RHS repeat domain-containing protein [Agrilutibacter solisilvae]|uniref:RHS repeat protein n=1 Tax=Agrilutibacter solisilvae TaxID=2763317 RepID=A0A975ARX9_9GAMM|nr:hypothetical protein [Lysobacter solisilvae]QSX77499.1 hypothetical protein I8J32_012130 [Lysobacter solisilvae]